MVRYINIVNLSLKIKIIKLHL